MNKASLGKHIGIAAAFGVVLFVVLIALGDIFPLFGDFIYGIADIVTPYTIVEYLTRISFGNHNDERGLVYVSLFLLIYSVALSVATSILIYAIRLNLGGLRKGRPNQAL